MLNRKDNKSNGSVNHSANRNRDAANNNKKLRRRFIISPKAPGRLDAAKSEPAKTPITSKPAPLAPAKALPPGAKGPLSGAKGMPAGASAKGAQPGAKGAQPGAPGASGLAQAVDLAETIKTLLHLAHENGHVTY